MPWEKVILAEAAAGVRDTMYAALEASGVDVTPGTTAQQVTWGIADANARRSNTNKLTYGATNAQITVDKVVYYADAAKTTLLGRFSLTVSRVYNVGDIPFFDIGTLTMPIVSS